MSVKIFPPVYFSCLTIILFLYSSFSYSQEVKINYTTANKKAIKRYENAIALYNQAQYRQTEEELLKAIAIDSTFVEAHTLLGDLYDITKRFDQAISSYRKAVTIMPDFFPGTFFNLANLEFKKAQYEEALDHYEKYNSSSESERQAKYKRIAEQNIRNCRFAIEAMKNPVPFNPVNLGDSVNTPNDEYLPALTADEQTLLFTMRHPATEQTYHPHDGTEEDFFITTKESDRWKRINKLPPPVNTPGNEGAHCLTPNGQILIFTGCNRTDGSGSCDLYFSKKNGDEWSKPVNMGTPINTGAWESQPSMSSDEKTLYFVSNRQGGKGDKDIWMSRLGDDGFWATPENLGDTINTPGTEQSPFIHPDNQTLYFASSGHTGMGQEDIFFSRRLENGSWSNPVNLGYPINTNADESSLFVTASGTTAYFASGKDKGDLDLYYFELPERARPVTVSYMKGRVFNSKTSEPVEANFELIDLGRNELIVKSKSNKGNGEFLVCLPAGRNYALNVSKKGFLFYSDHFELDRASSSVDPVIKDIALSPVEPGAKVILKNIFYETDRFDLKHESRAELEKLIQFLRQNPGVSIEISGHTDNAGDKKYNQDLSEKRAKSVYDYLAGNGISAGKLSFRGYGDTQPGFPNDSDENRAKNRRTEFRIIAVQ
ncbi:MAG: PD40 domain-containing protein [Bacteroidetes bacterium]|nr:PD40 domain-containing protein [Bacteroidota bacterium]